MTVKELISKLQEHDGDKVVGCSADYEAYIPAEVYEEYDLVIIELIEPKFKGLEIY